MLCLLVVARRIDQDMTNETHLFIDLISLKLNYSIKIGLSYRSMLNELFLIHLKDFDIKYKLVYIHCLVTIEHMIELYTKLTDYKLNFYGYFKETNSFVISY